MKYQTVLFDLDGTLLDTLEDLAGAANATLKAHGMPAHTVREIRSFLGNGMANLIERSAPAGTDKEELAALLADFKAYYGAHCTERTRPYAGIPELLAALRKAGIKTAMISNKGDFAVQSLAKDYFDGLLDLAVGERAGIPRKPAPDMVRSALAALHADPAAAIYVGDSEVDILTAKNAGLACISVTWGFRDAKDLRAHGATTPVNTVRELQNLLLTP